MINSSKNDCTAKNYYVQIELVRFSHDFESKEVEILDGINGNHKECSDFLFKKIDSTHSKYDFKNGKRFEYIGKKIDKDFKYERIFIALSYAKTEMTVKDMSNTLVAFCTSSRALFRLFTEVVKFNCTNVCELTNLSKSDVSNIKSGQRRFDIENAAKIAQSLNLLDEYFELLDYETKVLRKQMMYANTIKVRIS